MLSRPSIGPFIVPPCRMGGGRWTPAEARPPGRRRSLGSLDSRWFSNSRSRTAFRSATSTRTCSAPGASRMVPCASSRARGSSRCTRRSSIRAASSTRARPCSGSARSRSSRPRIRLVVPMRSLVDRIVRARAEIWRRRRVAPRHDVEAARGEHRHLGRHLTAARRLAAARRDGCRDARVARHARASTRSPRRSPRARASSSCSGCAPRCGGAASTELEYVPTGAAFAAYSLGFLGDDEVQPLRDGSVDPALVAARPRARAPQGLDPARRDRAVSARAIARPAARPVKRHPPRKVPSSAR